MIELYGHITSTEQLKYIESKRNESEPFIGITKNGKIYQYHKETDRLITISLSQLQEKLGISEQEAIRIVNSKGLAKLDSAIKIDNTSRTAVIKDEMIKPVNNKKSEAEYVTKEDLIEFKKDILDILNEFLRNLKGRK